jgi:hypothetical protein
MLPGLIRAAANRPIQINVARIALEPRVTASLLDGRRRKAVGVHLSGIGATLA